MVVVRGREMVVRCPTYFQAVKWARLECKSYKIPEPTTDLPDNEETDDVPLFCVQLKINGQVSAQKLRQSHWIKPLFGNRGRGRKQSGG